MLTFMDLMDEFLELSNSKLKFGEVEEFTGLNPSLLSLAASTSTLHELAATVKDVVVRFVNHNLLPQEYLY